MNWSDKRIKGLIENALAEDLEPMDVTTEAIVPGNLKAGATIRAKKKGILAGVFLAERIFKTVDKKIKFRICKNDGGEVKKGQVIARVYGKTKSILEAERVALNFIQRMSGIATLTNEFVKKVRHTKAKILDTRKTTPTFRLLEKYAVRMGGGENHRFGLYDMVLIKSNHIKAAGSIQEAISRVKSGASKLKLKKESRRAEFEIEIEVRNLEELRQVMKSDVDKIMLDNFELSQIRRAVRLVRKSKCRAKVEVSGNVNLKSVRKIAQTGVDFISVGALTHSAPALDMDLVIG